MLSTHERYKDACLCDEGRDAPHSSQGCNVRKETNSPKTLEENCTLHKPNRKIGGSIQ